MLRQAMQTKEERESLHFPLGICFAQLTGCIDEHRCVRHQTSAARVCYPLWMTGLLALFLTLGLRLQISSDGLIESACTQEASRGTQGAIGQGRVDKQIEPMSFLTPFLLFALPLACR